MSAERVSRLLQETDFAVQARYCQKIRKRCIRQEFQRDKATQHSVFGLVDHPMPPPPSFSTIR
jgi:hypothetical protein